MSYHKEDAGCDIDVSCSPLSASQNVTERHQQSEDSSLSFIPFERPTEMSPTNLADDDVQGLKEAAEPAPQSFIGGASSSVSAAIDKSPNNSGLDTLVSYFLTQPAPPTPRPSSGSFATHPTWGVIDHPETYHSPSQFHSLPDVSRSSSGASTGKVHLPGLLGSERSWRDDEALLSPTSSLMGTDRFEVHPYINGSTVPSGEVDHHIKLSGQQLGSSQICSKDPLVERHEAHSRRTRQSWVSAPSQTAYPRHNTRGGEVKLPRTVGANQDIIARPPAPSPAHPRWIAENKVTEPASTPTGSRSTPPSGSVEEQAQADSESSDSSPRDSSTSVQPGSPKTATSPAPEDDTTIISADPTSSSTSASKKRKRGDREDALEASQSRPSPSVKRGRPVRWKSPRIAPASSSSKRSPASSSRAKEGRSSGGQKSS